MRGGSRWTGFQRHAALWRRARASPGPALGVAGHGGGVLGQAGAANGDGVKARLPDGGALPGSAAPLVLSTLHTAPSASVKTMHLQGDREGGCECV